MDSCACKAIFGHWSKSENQNVHVHCLLGLKHMTTYERGKPATAGPVTDTYFELKMLCIFYFALESEKMAIMSGQQWYLKNNSIFPFLFLFTFFSNFNSQFQLFLGSIHPSFH